MSADDAINDWLSDSKQEAINENDAHHLLDLMWFTAHGKGGMFFEWWAYPVLSMRFVRMASLQRPRSTSKISG